MARSKAKTSPTRRPSRKKKREHSPPSSSSSRSPSPTVAEVKSESVGNDNRNVQGSQFGQQLPHLGGRGHPGIGGTHMNLEEEEKLEDRARAKIPIAIPIQMGLPPPDPNGNDGSSNGRRGSGSGNGRGNKGNEVIDENLSLDSVGGLTEQVKYMKDHVLYAFKNQEELRESWGYEPEKGIIFHGPPGTGKTLLAKAFAAEVNRNSEYPMSFFLRKGTDCFNMFIGETERNLRELFQEAKNAAPSIIFIDEIDGLCPVRVEGQHQFYSNVVTTLLGEIDAVKRGEVFLIGATNRLEAIDPAIRRPGRLGKQLAFQPPNQDGRKQILEIHLAHWHTKPSKEEVTFIAKQTSGYTGADLEQLCRHAFDAALDRVARTEKNQSLESLQVTRDDWVAAMGHTKKSNSNVFCNAYFSGEDLIEGMKPLLGGIKDEIQNRLQFLYAPGGSQSQASNFQLGVRILHVWHSDPSTLSILNAHIMPGVLAGIDPERVPVFSISLGSIPSLGPVEYLKQFFNQIQTCFKNNVVMFLPSIDTLWANMDTRAKDIFTSQLELLRGKRVILLMTANCDLKDAKHALKFVDTSAWIQQSLALRQPTAKEVSCFFEPLMASDAAHFGGNARTNKYCALLQELREEMEKYAPGKPLATVFNLHGTLSLLCEKMQGRLRGGNRQMTAKDVRELVSGFKTSMDNFKKDSP